MSSSEGGGNGATGVAADCRINSAMLASLFPCLGAPPGRGLAPPFLTAGVGWGWGGLPAM